MPTEDRDGSMRPEMRWTIGILVGLSAMVGLMILVVLVSLALEPPPWLQILMGVVLVAVGCILAWLVAAALGERDRRQRDEIEARRNAARPTPRQPSSR
jgi:membrane protein implicated in regulation of membrane protease activity